MLNGRLTFVSKVAQMEAMNCHEKVLMETGFLFVAVEIKFANMSYFWLGNARKPHDWI